MTQTQTPSFPGFPRGPNSPEVIATMPAPSAEFDALLAMICDAEADVWFGSLSERVVAIPGTELLTDEDDASFAI